MQSALRAAKRNAGRAHEPGPRRCAGALLLAAVAVAGCGGSGSKYPAFLPKSTLDPTVDRVLLGTMRRPALTVEGLPVEVRTRAFSVSVTVSGPIVPGEGLPYQPVATTCTWTITMKDATGAVPVALRDFHAVNHLGAYQVPKLVPGERPPPALLRPGRSIKFQIRAYQLVGEGSMQWAPDHRHDVAMWDYEVEND